MNQSLHVRTIKSKKLSTIDFDPKIFRLTYEENHAFCKYIYADSVTKENCKLAWRKSKLTLKNAIRDKERKRLQITFALKKSERFLGVFV